MRLTVSTLTGVSTLAMLAVAAPVSAQVTRPVQIDPKTPAESAVIQDKEDADRQQVTTAEGQVVPESQVITVTGSRIRLPNIENLQPTITVGEQYIEDRNLTNVADALNEIPGFRGSVTPNGSQASFGQGVNFVNFLGLGSNRSLTLVNSRRFVSSNVPTIFGAGAAGVQVDLNVIPTVLVDRIDTISIGGAPIYGSDAIAGTVNVILKTNYNGIDVQGTTRITEQGDGFSYNAGIVVGQNFLDDRLNVTGSYVRDGQDGILNNARSFFRDNITTAGNPRSRAGGPLAANDGRLNPGIPFDVNSTDGIPGRVLIRNRTIPFLTQGGLITSANGSLAARTLQFDSNGNIVPFNQGITGFLSAIEASGGDGFQFSDFSQIRSDLTRDVFNGFVTFEVAPAATLFVEGTYYHSRADELVQQPTFNSNLFGGASGPLTFTTDSPFLTAQARAALQAQGVTTFQVSRASTDLSDPTGFSVTDLYRVVGGLRGDFGLFGKTFNYEVSGNYGVNKTKDFRQGLDQQRFANAVNVTRNAAGQIVCTATPARNAAPGGVAPIADPNCVPLNLLGLGVASQAARDYVINDSVTNSRLEQNVFNANVGGNPFTLFGNPTGFNVGYEHRQEKGSFVPSQFDQQGRGRSVAINPTRGKFNVDEAFGELNLPVITDRNGLSFLNRLELTAAGRYVDNTVNGGFTAYSFGGIVAPIRDIQFRGNYTKSFRAPAITELFSSRANIFTFVPDLCSPSNRNAGQVPATRARNCAAFLAAFPNATPLDASVASIPGVTGGNPNLNNEVAKSFTYGIVLQPRFIPGLSASVDYIDINIEQPISSLSIAQIAGACFDNSNFNTADPANGNEFCSRISRLPAGTPVRAANGGSAAGQVVSDPQNPGARGGFVNGNRIFFSGIQSELNYRRRLDEMGFSGPGSIEVSGRILYVRRRLVDITGVAPSRSDGVIDDPEFQGQLNLRYLGDKFGIITNINYVGEQLFSRTSRGLDFREIDQLNDFATVNVSAFVDVDDHFRVNAAVTNIGNRIGEKFFSFLNPASINDDLGRRFSISARIRY